MKINMGDKQQFEIRTDKPLGFVVTSNKPMDAVSDLNDLGLIDDGEKGSVAPVLELDEGLND